MSCGYMGHICNDTVQFISRYRDENDYCIGGVRVHLYDDSTVRGATPKQIEALELHLLAAYAEYLGWHSKMHFDWGHDWPKAYPFDWVFPLKVRHE